MIDEKHYVTLSGKPYVLYQGLIEAAHQNGLLGISTQLIQVPNEENGSVAIVKATVSMKGKHPDSEGHVMDAMFDGYGDSSPENVKGHKLKRLLAMAETRAKSRALRDALGIGTTALEELSDGEESSTRPSTTVEAERSSPSPLSRAERSSPTPISQRRQTRYRDDEFTPGGVPISHANELIALLIKAGNKREEVGPYVWNAKPEAVEKKMNELKGKESW